jgi:hypothetical protein
MMASIMESWAIWESFINHPAYYGYMSMRIWVNVFLSYELLTDANYVCIE